MTFRFFPLWWPFLVLAFPFVYPWLKRRKQEFLKDIDKAEKINEIRINKAHNMNIPEVDFVTLTPIVEWYKKDGFIGDAGVSYFFKTNRGSVLYDIGFGPTRPAFSHNAKKLGFNFNNIDALVISHMHADHIGGINAQKTKNVTVPDAFIPGEQKICYLPAKGEAKGFKTEIIEESRVLSAGFASTGPLARSLFFQGYTEEQAVIAKIKNKGLVIFTGCGHPTLNVIFKMVRRLTNEPIYAIGGGLHFPIKNGRGNRVGIKFQTFIGTGKLPWQRISDTDLNITINEINKIKPEKVFLSGHDTCDYSLNQMKNKINAQTIVLRAGETYTI